MSSFFIFLSIVTTIVAVPGSNYCKMPCKDYGTGKVIPHIGCNHDGSFDKKVCSSDAKMVEMTSPLKNLFVKLHNEKRNLAAGGKVAGHSPACRMATIQWDDELAYLAGLNVKQCIVKHDSCRNTKAFLYSGQNLYATYVPPPAVFDTTKEIKNAVEGWFSEAENSTQEIIDLFPENPPYVGHFTVMVADRNVRLGCAASTYTTGNTYFLIACNYATTNMQTMPIYKKCPKAAKGCQTGTNPVYPNLCSQREVYDVNNWW